MKIYVASKVVAAPYWAAMRPLLNEVGIEVSSTWPWWDQNMAGCSPATSEQWANHWGTSCIPQAAECDILLFYLQRDQIACGQLIELGAALACGAHVFWVSDDWFSIQHHERVRVFPTLEAAVSALVAMAKGEQARRHRAAPGINRYAGLLGVTA